VNVPFESLTVGCGPVIARFVCVWRCTGEVTCAVKVVDDGGGREYVGENIGDKMSRSRYDTASAYQEGCRMYIVFRAPWESKRGMSRA
jgi:hypothetical protein